MEIILNLAWGLLAGIGVLMWMRCTPRNLNRKTQIVAMLLFILILFPVISAADDLSLRFLRLTH